MGGQSKLRGTREERVAKAIADREARELLLKEFQERFVKSDKPANTKLAIIGAGLGIPLNLQAFSFTDSKPKG